MLRNVLLFVALAVPGYLLVKCNVMKQEQSGVLSKVLMYTPGAYLVTGDRRNIRLKKAFFNPVLIAFPAGLASTFADEFGGDTENAVIFTLGTTMLSILTIPCLYWILNVFI